MQWVGWKSTGGGVAGTMAMLLMAHVAVLPIAQAHQFAASPFVTQQRQGRFAYLGVLTYRCDRGQRQIVCSGQAFLVSRCLILTSDHLARDAVDRRSSSDGLTKSFQIQGMAYDVVPVEAGLSADGAPIAENVDEDWGLMRITAKDCPGSRYGWLRPPTIDPARLAIGTDITVYSVDDNDFSRITASHGTFQGQAPGDMLLMTSASMRPGQSGGIVVTAAPDGSAQVIGMVQGANYQRTRFYRTGVKNFSPASANFFTNIFDVLSKFPVANLIRRNQA